jgi:multiple sugar transport system permease protein
MRKLIKFLKRKYPNNIYSIKFAVLLLIPAFLLRGFTSFYPMVYTGYLSFFNYSPAKGAKEFIGFGNFVRLVGDIDVGSSLSFTIFFTLVSTFLQICLGLMIALLLDQIFIGKSVVRVVNILPWAIPAVVVGLAAKFAFNDQFGIVNDILYRVIRIRPVWFNSFWAARIATILVDVWKYVGFVALVFLAALQGVPHELREAAEVDGANRFQTIFRIVLPLIKPIIIMMTIFTTVWRITSFDLIYSMTQGGPGSATSVVSYKIYQIIFHFLKFGYGSALSFLLLIIVLIISGVSMRFLKQAEAEI